jgi:hypothetical protein
MEKTRIELLRTARVQNDSIKLVANNKGGAVPQILLEVMHSLKMGRAWIGECLKFEGAQYPYEEDSNRKEVKDIKPSSDKAMYERHIIVDDISDNSELRIMIAEWIELLVKLKADSFEEMRFTYEQAIVHLTEARFHLGFILGVIFNIEKLKEEIAACSPGGVLLKNKTAKEHYLQLVSKYEVLSGLPYGDKFDLEQGFE